MSVMWGQQGLWNWPGPGQSPGSSYYNQYSQDVASLYWQHQYNNMRQYQDQANTTPENGQIHDSSTNPMELTPPYSEHEAKDEDKETDKPYHCGFPKCAYETNRRNNLKRHMMTMHERLSSPHFCCGVTFFRKADMRAHTKEVSQEW